MKGAVSLGYLTPRPQALRPGPWIVITSAGITLQHPSSIPDWDYLTDLRVVRNLDIDLATARTDCGLDPTAEVRASIIWHATVSGRSGVRGASRPVALVEGANQLEVALDGGLLGGTLNLGVRVMLGHPSGTPAELAPRRVGSVLWSDDTTRVVLEGAGTRFPVVPVSFAESGIAGGRRAAWCFSIMSSDPSDSGTGSIRLYLNSDHERIQRYLAEPDQTAAEQFAVGLRFAVTRLLVTAALRNPDLDMDVEYDAGSLGELLTSLLRQLFPGRPIESLRGDLATDPGEFEAELQALTGYEP